MAPSTEPPRSLPQPVGTGMPIDPEKLGNLMAERGLSRLALADLVAQVAVEQDIRSPHGHLVTCSRDAVSKWLKGQRRPKISTLVALCAALNCTQQDILYADPEYGLSADVVADSLAGNATEIIWLRDCISPRILTILLEHGCTTLADLAKADADGKLMEITGLVESPLDVVRRELAIIAGFVGGSDEQDA
jgi:transcriptional regulator with XRE-family HTH domain